jgi:hypothetical protein
MVGVAGDIVGLRGFACRDGISGFSRAMAHARQD